MGPYALGIDIGTESVRVAIYDEHGTSFGFGVSENSTHFCKPGWAEQSVEQWERSFFAAIHRAFSGSSVSPEEIIGIGIDATCPTLVALDVNNIPLRNAIMWMDIRAVQEAEEISRIDHPSLSVLGHGNVSPEWFPCKALWLKRHEPEIYKKARMIFDQPDWLTYLLTGEYTLSLNTVTVRWFYNSQTGGFPKDLYAQIGLDDFFEKIPSRVIRPGELAGPLLSRIAERTGLRAGIPVAGGGADAFIGVIGVNALSPGKLALITGSSHLQIGMVEHVIHAKGMNGSFPDAIIQGQQVIEAGQASTGSVVKWFIDNLIGAKYDSQIDEKTSIYEVMRREAEKITPGADGLLVIDHWQGNRTPWGDPTSRGIIRGLTLSHTTAHIYRAILEGIAYGTEVILSKMQDKGVYINEIVACGGAAKSDFWMQIHADVIGKPISIPTECQAVSLGSAILAFSVAGYYSSIKEAANHMTQVKKII